jgi:hypothetical protein
MTKRSPLPSGHAGVYRADDGKRWEAYVADKGDLILLGIYPTIRAAATARAKYWKAHEVKPTRRMRAAA